jgi:Flp pilus assembly protein TadG
MMMRIQGFVNFWADRHGTTAVEFAIVTPVFILLLVGAVYICLGLFLVGSLHYAVEEGARCASVKTTVCSDSPTTLSYTQNQYFGPSPTPTFTYATAACGNVVSGSLTYVVNLGITKVSVPVTASACFP